MLHEIPHHGLDAVAAELAIVSLPPARIREALQLEDRVGVRRESLGHGLQHIDVLASNFSPIGVEVDEFRVHEPVPVATRQTLREPRFGAAGTSAHLTHFQVEAVEALVGNVDRLACLADASCGFTQLRLLGSLCRGHLLGELALRRIDLLPYEVLRRTGAAEHGDATAEDARS